MKERKKKYLSRLTNNCENSQKLRIHNNGTVDICILEEKQKEVGSGVFVCEDDICIKCPFFKCKNTEESVLFDFNKILRNPSLCGKEYPKLAILLWVLEGEIKKESLFFRILFKIRAYIYGF